MQKHKNKSAIGAGTPTAEKNNTFTVKRITQKSEKIKAVIQYPGRPISKVIDVENSKKAICRLLSCKYIATAKLPGGYIALYDKDGHKLEKHLSIRIGTKAIPGIALIVAGSDKHFRSLTNFDIQSIRGYLLKNFIFVE